MPQSTGAEDVTEAAAARHAAMRLMAVRSAALGARDRSAWEATVADPASAEGARALLEYDNLVTLGVLELTATQVTEGEGTSVEATTLDAKDAATAHANADGSAWHQAAAGARSHTVKMSLAVSIPGFDLEARVVQRTVTVTSTPHGWRIARGSADTDQLQVWDLPQLRVLRSATSLVAGNVAPSVLHARLADADAAQERLAAALGAATPAVLVVPASAAEAERQLGRAAGSLTQVAAATDGKRSARGTAGADRVVLNPVAFEKLTPEGRRVVVAHELTHVATRAMTTVTPPLWLDEGVAEYIAWGSVRMPVETAAAALLAEVRAQSTGVSQPRAGEAGAGAAAGSSVGRVGAVNTDALRLPEATDFDPARSDLATAYQAAWLAVRKIAEDHGEGKLWEFYRAVTTMPGAPAATTVEDAFRSVLGRNMVEFIEQWRADVTDLAGRSR